MPQTAWKPAAALLLALLCTACGAGGNADELNRQDSGFSVSLLDGSLHAAVAEPVSTRIEQEGARVTLHVGAHESSALRAAYLAVEFDPRHWQPAEIRPLETDNEDQRWLGLAIPDADGRLLAGIVATGLDSHPGLQSSTEILAIEFIRTEGQPHVVQRTASAAPVNQGSQCTLAIDQPGGRLNWEYRCTGDYDQNGLVSISDLTPLGIHFGKSGPFSDTGIEGVVDGDGNGEINLGDITSIGQNFGRGVESYNIYFSDDDADAPQSAAEASSIPAAGSYSFSSASGSAAAERLQFSRASVITGNNYYWIRPVHQGVEGIASNLVFAIPLSPEAPLADITADPATGIAPLQVTLDASGSTDANADIDHYDWDFENDGTYDATTTTASIIRNYGGGPWTAKVRVVDSGGLSDTATVNMSFLQPSWNVSTVDSNALILQMARMTVADGKPIIVYDQANAGLTIDRLYVIRSLDTQGQSWSSTLRIDNQLDYVGDFDLSMVAGNPAIAYRDTTHGQFRYIRASAADGSAWNNPVILETDDSVSIRYGTTNSLAVVDGKPAVCFSGESALRIFYKAADDATGTSWPLRTLVNPVITGVGGLSLVDNSGRPGILWSSIPLAKAGYIRTLEFNGVFVNTDIYSGNMRLAQDLLLHDGMPLALVNTGSPGFDIRLAHATDSEGSGWDTPQIIGGGSQNGVSMSHIGGIPMIVTPSSGSSELLIYRADNPQAMSWSGPETIDGGVNQLVSTPSLVEVNGVAAVCYGWGDTAAMDYELRYAIYF